MPKEVLKNASIVVNSVDLSNHLYTVTVTEGQDAVEKTAMGDTSHTYMPGLYTFAVDCEFYQDFDGASLDATIRALKGNAGFTVVVKRDTGTTTTTNPARSCSMILGDYSSISGTVGDAHRVPVAFLPAGDMTVLTT